MKKNRIFAFNGKKVEDIDVNFCQKFRIFLKFLTLEETLLVMFHPTKFVALLSLLCVKFAENKSWNSEPTVGK